MAARLPIQLDRWLQGLTPDQRDQIISHPRIDLTDWENCVVGAALGEGVLWKLCQRAHTDRFAQEDRDEALNALWNIGMRMPEWTSAFPGGEAGFIQAVKARCAEISGSDSKTIQEILRLADPGTTTSDALPV